MSKFKIGDKVRIARINYADREFRARMRLGMELTIDQLDVATSWTWTWDCGCDGVGFMFSELEPATGPDEKSIDDLLSIPAEDFTIDAPLVRLPACSH